MDDQPAGARQLLYLHRQGKLSDDALRRGLALIDRPRDPREWAELAGRGLAALGVTLLCVAVIYFFAFNWDKLERGDTFVAVQVALALLVGGMVWRGPRSSAGFASSLGAFLLIGAALALFGQTYQTGRDPWQLFAGWAVLSLPLVAMGRSPVLGVMAVEVAAVGLAGWMRLQGPISIEHLRSTVLALSAWHLVPWLGWELAGRRFDLPRWPAWFWMFSAWLLPFLATGFWLVGIDLHRDEAPPLVATWALLTLLQVIRGRFLGRDRAMLALAGSGILLLVGLRLYIFVDTLKLGSPEDALVYGAMALLLSGLGSLLGWGVWKGGRATP